MIDHDLAGKPLDERAGNRRRNRGNQVDPVGRQARAQNRGRDHPALEAAYARVGEHHFAVGDHVRPADFDNVMFCGVMALGRIFQSPLQIRQNVADGDRLHLGLDPFRGDHHWQPFGQIPHHLKRDTARTDDDGGAKLGDGNPGGGERLTGRLPRGQMLAHALVTRAQTAQIDDVLYPGVFGGGGEVARGLQVAVFKPGLGCAHRMNQVVGGVDAGKCRAQALGLEHVGFSHLDLGKPRLAAQPLPVTHQTTNRKARLEQPGDESTADIAGSAGNENGSF